MTRPTEMPDWFQRAAAMRDGMVQTASSLDTTELTRKSGGVTLTMTANGALRSVRVDPALIKDPAALERDLVAAHQQAHDEIQRIARNMLAPLQAMVSQVQADLGRSGQ